jgi:hypothetical protein
MSFTIEYQDWSRIVHLRFFGDSSAETMQEGSIAMVNMLNAKGSQKLLTDFTEATSIAFSSFDVSDLPAHFRALGLQKPFVEGLVAPRGGPMRQTAEFYETVTTNRGGRVRVFETASDALTWLLSIS